MRLDVYVPVLAAVLLGLTVGRLARPLPPAAGVRVLVGAGVCCAGGWVWALGLLAWTGLGQLPIVAEIGGWSGAVLRAGNPVPAPVADASGGLLLIVTATFIVTAVRRLRAVWSCRAMVHQMGRSQGELVVLPDPGAEAFALPSLSRRAGRIVVSTGMLCALDVDERRVLFAHERAHLAGADHWWMLAAQLCAAASPLLVKLPAAADFMLERAADEAAAAAVGDRRLAARSLARAGLATLQKTSAPATGIALGYATSAVQARISALLSEPPSQQRRWLLAAVVLTVVVAGVAALDAGSDLEHLFELAISADRVSH